MTTKQQLDERLDDLFETAKAQNEGDKQAGNCYGKI